MKAVIMLSIKYGTKSEELPYDEIPLVTRTQWGKELITAIQEQGDI